jgi:NitT/TauT family transport system permease protein
VNGETFALPGIGSYVAAASEHQQIGRLLLAILTMVAMIVVVNAVFWRPLTAWAERFRTEDTVGTDQQRSVVLDLLRRSMLPRVLGRALRPVGRFLDRATRVFGVSRRPLTVHAARRRAGDIVLGIAVGVGLAWGLVSMLDYVSRQTGLQEFAVAVGWGFVTFARVVVLLVVASLVWIPVGLWIGLDPRVTRFAQPVVQVLASFPANFLFPFFTLFLLRTGISIDIGGIVLMALGSQWYILFNVIAGASAIPNDVREASRMLRLGRAQRWRKVYLPAVFGSWVTGALTAAGGAWNASIVAEVVSYGGHTLEATGLGSYIATATQSGDFARTLVGVSVMSLFVVGLNRTLWRRLYALAESRYSLT